jgi:hypothetical protein
MNVGSSFMHEDINIDTYEEYEEDIDEEGERLIESRPTGRSVTRVNLTNVLDEGL